jgi:hypothetical protein
MTRHHLLALPFVVRHGHLGLVSLKGAAGLLNPPTSHLLRFV